MTSLWYHLSHLLRTSRLIQSYRGQHTSVFKGWKVLLITSKQIFIWNFLEHPCRTNTSNTSWHSKKSKTQGVFPIRPLQLHVDTGITILKNCVNAPKSEKQAVSPVLLFCSHCEMLNTVLKTPPPINPHKETLTKIYLCLVWRLARQQSPPNTFRPLCAVRCLIFFLHLNMRCIVADLINIWYVWNSSWPSHHLQTVYQRVFLPKSQLILK